MKSEWANRKERITSYVSNCASSEILITGIRAKASTFNRLYVSKYSQLLRISKHFKINISK